MTLTCRETEKMIGETPRLGHNSWSAGISSLISGTLKVRFRTVLRIWV